MAAMYSTAHDTKTACAVNVIQVEKTRQDHLLPASA